MNNTGVPGETKSTAFWNTTILPPIVQYRYIKVCKRYIVCTLYGTRKGNYAQGEATKKRKAGKLPSRSSAGDAGTSRQFDTNAN